MYWPLTEMTLFWKKTSDLMYNQKDIERDRKERERGKRGEEKVERKKFSYCGKARVLENQSETILLISKHQNPSAPAALLN